MLIFKKTFFIITFQLFSLLICCIYAQSPMEVWVSQKYDLTTPGWDTIRFDTIQNGIDAVAVEGIVHVDTGVYHGGIIINKQLHLIGEGAEVTEINADSSYNAVLVNEVSGGSISGISFTNASGDGIGLLSSDSLTIQNNICRDNDISGIYIYKCENIRIAYNTFFENGSGNINLNLSHKNVISNNTVNTDISALGLGASCSNLIENNEFYSKEHINVSLGSSSNNNRFVNNKISGGPCYLIRSEFCSNNLFANNDLSGDGAGSGMDLKYASNCIVSNNEITGFHTVAIRFYHADSTIIVGNNIHDPIIAPDDMLQGGFFIYGESSNNLIVGNEISDVPRGISVLQHSDSNQIINNHIRRSSSSIIISNSNYNTISKNNFDEYILRSFDNGNNNWSSEGIGNYWSDYSPYCNNVTGYKIPPSGMDYHPQETSFVIEPIDTPELSITSVPELFNIEYNISNQVIWDNQNIELTRLAVLDGGSLNIVNSTVTFSNQFSGSSGIHVSSRATLKISNSEVFFNGVSTWVDEGAILEIKDSKLYNVGFGQSGSGFRVETDNVLFTDNIIEDGGDFTFQSNSEITNNYFKDVYVGITIEDDNSTISNNRIENVVLWGILLGGSNNNIHDNTITNCWSNALFIGGGESNNIYRNNFSGFGNSVRIGSDLNNFYINDQGNYYSDYLDRLPSGRESELFSGQWNLPYHFTWGDNIDEHPSMVCFYPDTVIDVPDSPHLIAPDSNSSINFIDPRFRWLNSENTKSYRIQISEDSTFNSPTINLGNIYDTTFCHVAEMNKKYYWRVIALNDGGYSNWSEVRDFTICEPYNRTDSITINQGESYKGHMEKGTYVENLKTELGCDSIITTVLTVTETETILMFQMNQIIARIYPNPSSGIITVSFENITDKIRITIYSIYGEKLFDKLYTKSDTELTEIINLQDQPNGIYLIKFSNGLESKTEKIVIN